MTAGLIAGGTRVRLHDLSMRADGDEWIVGRVETGDFIAVPALACEILRLLGEGLTIDSVRDRVRAATGEDVDVAGFAGSLMELGFVAEVDDERLDGAEPPRSTLPWLRPAHVRWLLTWPTAVAVAVLVLAAVVAVAWRPSLAPRYGDLLWTSRGSFVLAASAITAWLIIGLHELGHLATARAVGVPGRMSLSTRLLFLAAQTDVSGIWAAPRWTRIVVYLSGIAVNLAVAAAGVLVRVWAAPGTLPDRLAAVTTMTALVLLVSQFFVFMRTDLYFVLQDLSGCRNLFADGSAYALWWARLRRGPDPSPALPARERRAVRWYTVLLVVGSAISLGVAFTVTVPVAVTLIADAVTSLAHPATAAARLDAAITITLIGGFWIVWGRSWWARHGGRVRSYARRRLAGRARISPPEEVNRDDDDRDP
ncbi:M50 family metallopeptidase [Paractinoplanes globisporus]|uniref:M50 family metallopeptidase n=1 Tax=Paractinoplanes globisporus TaxID=113565 RepID=A0ABW6WUU6_9ACTN|nr:M50 family metallopeptidase [Actinoplanes globisporus]